jgi:hypothetical protein
MVAARAGVEPTADDLLGRWVARMGIDAFSTAALGMIVLVVAQVASWERWTWGYVSSPQQPMAGLERWRGAEPELLRMVSALEGSPEHAPANLRLETVSANWLSVPYAPLGLHPLLLGVLACALLGVAAVIVARTGRRPAREWRAGVASSLGLLLASLVAVDTLALARYVGKQQNLDGVCVSRECRGGADAIGQELYRALVAQELQVHAEHSARIVERQSGEELATVHILAAAPASIFARWRMTWDGPQRLQPHVLFTVVSATKDERAEILADGGLVDSDDLAASAWPGQLRDLLRTACAVSSEK